ncbi:MAG: serine protease [Lachnospiraceae bacterium]|nr:serine protease [Lachnospiraceae bacterium]
MSDFVPNEHEKPIQDFVFMKEQIKERPLNKRKLIRRTLITASMAVIFGMIACLTFLVLEPLISNWLYPEETPQAIEFPEDTEEMLPEDMLITEESENAEAQIQQPTIVTQTKELEIEDYQMLYDKLYATAKEVSKSVVTVTGVTSNVDWFDDTFESKGRSAGFIIAENGREYFVVTDGSRLKDAESISVAFADGTQATAEIRKVDPVTGLAVITVMSNQLSNETKENIAVAALGNSNASNLVGTPVIALGSPLGTSNSILYGTITSTGTTLNLVDSSYKLLTTDMYASKSAGGVLVTTKGRVIGIVNMQYNSADMENLLSAIGISELKKTVEMLSNEQDKAYFGIYGTDVTWEAYTNLNVPLGAYVTSIEMDSPAMQVGIQSGDIIVRIGETDITSYGEYISTLHKLTPETPVMVTVKRQVAEEYKEVEIEVTPAVLQ